MFILNAVYLLSFDDYKPLCPLQEIKNYFFYIQKTFPIAFDIRKQGFFPPKLKTLLKAKMQINQHPAGNPLSRSGEVYTFEFLVDFRAFSRTTESRDL